MGFTAAGTAPDFLTSAGRAPDSLFIGSAGSGIPNQNSPAKIRTNNSALQAMFIVCGFC